MNDDDLVSIAKALDGMGSPPSAKFAKPEPSHIRPRKPLTPPILVCSVAALAITTIMFAAMFAQPGALQGSVARREVEIVTVNADPKNPPVNRLSPIQSAAPAWNPPPTPAVASSPTPAVKATLAALPVPSAVPTYQPTNNFGTIPVTTGIPSRHGGTVPPFTVELPPEQPSALNWREEVIGGDGPSNCDLVLRGFVQTSSGSAYGIA